MTAFFYIVIAQYFLDTGLSTFNGYIETNGYHPLWQLITVVAIGISRITSLDPLVVVGLFYHMFIAGSIYILHKINKVIHLYSLSIVSMILIFLFIANGTLQNMESAVALFFVLYTLYAVITIDHLSIRNFLSLGDYSWFDISCTFRSGFFWLDRCSVYWLYSL